MHLIPEGISKLFTICIVNHEIRIFKDHASICMNTDVGNKNKMSTRADNIFTSPTDMDSFYLLKVIWIIAKRIVQLYRNQLQPHEAVRQEKYDNTMLNHHSGRILIAQEDKGEAIQVEEQNGSSHLNQGEGDWSGHELAHSNSIVKTKQLVLDSYQNQGWTNSQHLRIWRWKVYLPIVTTQEGIDRSQ